MKAWAWVWGAWALSAAACSQGPSGSCPNDLPSTSVCASATPSWTTDVHSIFVAKCQPCHQPGGTGARILLDTYANVSSASGSSLDQIYGCLMPPADAGSGYVLLAQERRDAMTWLVCGAPNN